MDSVQTVSCTHNEYFIGIKFIKNATSDDGYSKLLFTTDVAELSIKICSHNDKHIIIKFLNFFSSIHISSLKSRSEGAGMEDNLRNDNW